MAWGAPQFTTGAPLPFSFALVQENQAATTTKKMGSGRIFLPGILDAGYNANSEKHDSSDGDPVGGHVRKMRPVNQAADNNQETQRVQSE
jgi:hypothetical protein